MNDQRDPKAAANATARTSSTNPEVSASLSALGERLRRARIARDVTLAEMAQRMGVQPSTLSRLERGAPGAGIEVMALALWHMGLLSHLNDVAAAHLDAEGQRLAELRQPSRARGRRQLKSAGWDGLDKL
ncbi:helix-turn-helix transcriptional regulator [Pelomonas sp. APW6]|uniref:Helix-turn-helix transcriptional regulator n=1 Tax=Roseateles subflavus TaxID=3053353 RepID=A0ABT7LS25_9BURK|nr:helix-turn-helix transcriptional regulator [Pelomonas sp. APW6]MDL5034271.1 helix-turn-helix transcriptional regulator [Pelomonas sp. APW6]